MTVIVVRGYLMATDSGLWQDESLIADDVQKIERCRHGIFAVSGHVGVISAVKKAMDDSALVPTSIEIGKDSMVVLLTHAGQLMVYDDGGCDAYPLPFYAIGPAAPVAYGALHMGADAATACEIAIKVGPWAAGKVQCLSVSGEAQSASEPEEDFDPASINPLETYAEGDDTPLWKRERGL
jgi:hypothetical protein